MNLGHRDDFDQRMGDTIEIEKLRRWRIFLRFGSVLFQLDLFDAHSNSLAILAGDTVVVVQVYIAVSRKRFC